ncbi:MAG: RNA polymerase sigma factor [Verrucomicrobia bacterium]|nr:RNA polymerase sigma factor [Verrucomicrobiota bacterium]
MLSCSPDVAIESEGRKGRSVNAVSSPSLPADFESLMDKGFALAIQMLGSEQDASDVIQDSLRKLVHSGRFDSRKGCRQAFFLKMVRNGCLDAIRRRKPHDEEKVATLVDGEKSPDRLAEQRELDLILRREIEGLPLDQREIVLLRDFHDLSYAEIAEVMGIRQGTVMSRLHRARAELRQRVRKYL